MQFLTSSAGRFFHKKIYLGQYRYKGKRCKKEKEIIASRKFVELPDLFEQEIADDLFKGLEHKKTKNIRMLNRRLKMLKLLKPKHRSQIVNFENLNRNLIRLTMQQQKKNYRLMLLIYLMTF